MKGSGPSRQFCRRTWMGTSYSQRCFRRHLPRFDGGRKTSWTRQRRLQSHRLAQY